jgi:hypothetical protein
VAALVGGCGLIDSDIADFDLSLPRKTITLDTADWELQVTDQFPEVPCADTPGLCQAAAQDYCTGAGCFPMCDGTNCKVTVQVALWNTFDLAAEKPELAALEDEPVVNVTIDEISYQVSENTLNVPTPELTIYLAPQTVMNPGDPRAEAIGTIASIPAGGTIQHAEVTMAAGARDTMERYLGDFQTPFNVIVGGVVDIEAGDAIPEGRLVAVVDVSARAGI